MASADRKDLPYWFGVLPSCQHCGSLSLTIEGTRKQSDGSKLQYGKCDACGETTKLVWEVRQSDDEV